MKTMRITIVALILVVAMTLAGCGGEVGIKITKDGKVISTIVYVMDKESVDNYATEMGMSADEFLKTIGAPNYKTVTTNGIKEYRITYMEQTSKIDNYIIWSEGKGSGNVNTFYDVVPAQESKQESRQELITQLETLGIKYSDLNNYVVVEMPEKIQNTNGRIDATNPKKVYFDYDGTKEVICFATTNKDVTIKDAQDMTKAVKKTQIKKIKNVKGKKVKVTLKSVKGATSYQVQYSKNNLFNKAKKVTTKKTTTTIKKLTKKKTYYVRARVVKKNAAMTRYSQWSKAKKVTIKK